MNKKRREFSSRGKSFNSNSNTGANKNLNHSDKWMKKSPKGTMQHESTLSKGIHRKPQKAVIKSVNHLENGFAAAKKPQLQKHRPTNASEYPIKPSTVSQPNEEKVVRNLNDAKKKVQKPEQKSTDLKEPVGKRKKQQNTAAPKKLKKTHPPLSESDSDAEDYIDKFFSDLSADDQGDSQLSSSSTENEETSSEKNSTETGSSSSEPDHSNEMSLEKLLNFYGNFQDNQAKPSSSTKSPTAQRPKKSIKTEKRKNKLKTPGTNQWVEEDNDVSLVYRDSDSDQASPSKALVPVGDTLQDTSDDDNDFVPEEESEDEEEDVTSEDEMVEDDSETNEDSLSSEYSSCKYESSDYDSDEDESSLSEGENYDDEYSSYWDNSYDSEDDGDYIPSEDEDDLYIGRGTARIYEIDDNNVSFNSDIETAQIVELPSDGDRKRSVTTSATDSQSDEEESELCPDLVPIYDEHGRLIDNTEMQHSKKTCSPSKKNNIATDSAQDNCDANDADGVELSPNMEDIAESLSQQESDPRLDVAKLPNFQFYDSIDMRMSLVVLKSTLFFSGHLTVQPLVGGLEIMGYTLKSGESRTAFAARGFHCLNLTPLPKSDGYNTKTLNDLLQRLEKHFLDADLKILSETFDPSNSVLALLQSDCNNRRVEVIDKYMPEETLFPKVEFLKRGVFYTTEYLLNAEFLTEHVEKCTTLFKSEPEWEKIPLKQSSRIVVIGGKGAGKSTLCQYLVNQAIGKFKKAVLIDLDIGQPIQHIPETMSVTIVTQPLLGVAHFNPVAPRKSWLFGSLDVVSSPIFYIQNVRQLIRYCHQHRDDFANIPWIVNTMGYSTGFGDELMAAIIRMLSPSDVVQLVSTKKSLSIPNFQNAFTSDHINQYSFNILLSEVQEFCKGKMSFRHCQLDVSYPRRGFSLNAPKRRNLMLLAHLANILNDCSSEWFNEVRPFCAPLDRLQVLITREDQSLAEQQLPAVLNATLVYLCRKTDVGSLYECLGVGIVRGVDKNNHVFLLQSLPPEQLAEITVLAICSSSLPNAIFLRQSTRIQGSIPYVFNVG
ncbi:polynucleotide 5'-hydroxyl-kinase NOL9 isoform X2 [Wyeomyia smithii]|uniref:polynucleotide 5'-hydroxyl-kinase NOL9 isoform X2 n=1 Tax=Wyeomyia smithii TaxID=174621 RepID=UPI002467B09E|nr:polynucleotide 5'-hydroxyl-kinase NOL9 isoform X2 [Wyeomyia smithii]